MHSAKGNELIASENCQKDKIKETNDKVLRQVDKIVFYSDKRKQRLRENWSLLMFYWRCELVETWIIQKEDELRNSESLSGVTNLVTIKQLIAKHESFSNSLEAFENEGIRAVVDLRCAYEYRC